MLAVVVLFSGVGCMGECMFFWVILKDGMAFFLCS